MFKWLKEWYEIRAEYHERLKGHCESCDILKIEVERLRLENSKLLDRILTPTPVPKVERNDIRATLPGPARHTPWRVRQQQLEAEDKERAKLMRQAPNPNPVTTDELEKEMDIASEKREQHGH